MEELDKLIRPLKRFFNSTDARSETLRNLLATYIYSTAHSEETIHNLLRCFSEIISNSLLRGANHINFEIALSLMQRSIRLIKLGADLRNKSSEDFLIGEPNDVFTEIQLLLDSISSHCRYRFYSIHPKDKCYRGLKSEGMAQEYVNKFDVNSPESFKKTTAIPFAQAPFAPIPQTKCFLLTDKSLEKVTEEQKEWYINELFLGDRTNGVPATYTWEFTVDGVAEKLCRDAQEVDQAVYSLALSIDAGNSNEIYENRVLDIWLVQILDALWSSSFGKDLGSFFAYVIHGFRSQAIDSPVTLVVEGSNNLNQIDASKSQESLKFSWDIEARFIGSGFKSWVGAANDKTVELLFETFDKVRNHESNIIALGPSGAGKEVFLTAIHNEGSTANGPLGKVNCPTLPQDPKAFSVFFYGAEPHAYTGAHVSKVPIPGILEQYDKGSVILDEFLSIPEENQVKLRTILSEFQDNPIGVFKRDGGNKEIETEIRFLATGKRDEEIDLDLKRRLPTQILIPGWYELNIESRTAILRWHIERSFSKREGINQVRNGHNIEQVRVSKQLFEFIIEDQIKSAFASSNMGYVRNAVRASISLNEEETEETTAFLTLNGLRNGVELYDGMTEILEERLRIQEEEFPEELFFGSNSIFEKMLTPTQKIGFAIAKCEDWENCSGCVNPEELQLLNDLEEDELWDTLYFLYATVWWREITKQIIDDDQERTFETKKEDGDFTAATVVKRHIGNANVLRFDFSLWLEHKTGHKPTNFRCSKPKTNKGFGELQQRSLRLINKRRLFAANHLMRCAVLGFPDFPFWDQY